MLHGNLQLKPHHCGPSRREGIDTRITRVAKYTPVACIEFEDSISQSERRKSCLGSCQSGSRSQVVSYLHLGKPGHNSGPLLVRYKDRRTANHTYARTQSSRVQT